jgi:hypothetical protein
MRRGTTTKLQNIAPTLQIKENRIFFTWGCTSNAFSLDGMV